jgi:hypothetical protein
LSPTRTIRRSTTTCSTRSLPALLGAEGTWQPFVSGGIGAISLNAGLDAEDVLGIDSLDETELGGNIGGGLMAFARNWGFRGDIRYFTQVGDAATDTLFLNDVDFWRGNVGLAYRW